MIGRRIWFWLVGGLLAAGMALAADLPACLSRAEGETTRAALINRQPSDQELLARLAYAESRSTGFADDPRVYRGIAWGVINRVRLSEISPSARRQYGQGVAGVIFQPRQFNPAVSPRSPFSQDFLCPKEPERWRLAEEAAAVALRGQNNPLIQTDWERKNGRSLVVNFYYPQSPQARGPLAPWEGDVSPRFIGDPAPDGDLPPAERIRFYRLTRPPPDAVDDSRR